MTVVREIALTTLSIGSGLYARLENKAAGPEQTYIRLSKNFVVPSPPVGHKYDVIDLSDCELETLDLSVLTDDNTARELNLYLTRNPNLCEVKWPNGILGNVHLRKTGITNGRGLKAQRLSTDRMLKHAKVVDRIITVEGIPILSAALSGCKSLEFGMMEKYDLESNVIRFDVQGIFRTKLRMILGGAKEAAQF